MTPTNHYAVAIIRSKEILYVGRNAATAAQWLSPGTCWGKGATEESAIEDAVYWATWFNERRAARRSA